MSITNTFATYLIFLAYINLTKFEGLISIVAVGHALRAFSLWRLVNKRVLRGRIRKDSSLFFFFFSLFFSLVFFSFSFFSFYFFFGGGEGGLGGSFLFVVFFLGGWGSRFSLGGYMGPLQGYYQTILVVNERWVIFGERDKPSLLFSIKQKRSHHVAFKLWCWHVQFHDWQRYA